MANNKIVYGNETLMDLTEDTVTPETLLEGITAHNQAGNQITGTLGDFTGATATEDGEHGLVPAPEAGDESKFLKGDGSWADLGNAGHTIQDSSGTDMDTRPVLQFIDQNVDDDSSNGKTVIHGQIQVSPTEAHWNSLTQEQKDDPNIYWVRPWADSEAYATDRTPIGTVLSMAADESVVSNPFPTDDYLLCNGTEYSIEDYPKLAEYFADAYGSVNHFGGDGTTTFAVPDFTTDYPTNGVLAIKAKITSSTITAIDVDDAVATEDNVWSAKKVSDEVDTLDEKIDSTAEDMKVVVVTTSSFSSLPQTITNDKISENHVVINSVLSNPAAQISDWTVDTTNGSLTVSGSISGNTTLTLYLGLA